MYKIVAVHITPYYVKHHIQLQYQQVMDLSDHFVILNRYN